MSDVWATFAVFSSVKQLVRHICNSQQCPTIFGPLLQQSAVSDNLWDTLCNSQQCQTTYDSLVSYVRRLSYRRNRYFITKYWPWKQVSSDHCLLGSDALYYGRNLPMIPRVMLSLSLQKMTNHARRRMKGENIPEVACRWSEKKESSIESIWSPAEGRCASVEQVGDKDVTFVFGDYFRWYNG